MLFGQLIEAKQLTILKGIDNFFFVLYHLWSANAFCTYAQVKYPLGFLLIMIKILRAMLKEVLHLLNVIYIKGCVAKPHAQSARGSKRERVLVVGLAVYFNYSLN